MAEGQQTSLEAPETAADLPAEPPASVANSTANVESVTTNMEPPRQQAALAAPAPKRKGRPAGSKDTVKRTRKPAVHVRIEPLEVKPPEQPRVPTPRPEPEPVTAPVAEPKQPVEIEESKSPRTLLRETSRHLMSLRSLVHDNRKADHVKKYTQNWATWTPH